MLLRVGGGLTWWLSEEDGEFEQIGQSGSSAVFNRKYRKYRYFSDLDLCDEQHELGAEKRSRNRWIWRGIGGIGR
jgi:hypothetical protein